MKRILCLGDVVGRPGREALKKRLSQLKTEHKIDFCIVNGENASGGLGLDTSTAEEIRSSGADVITLGDHTWQRKDIKQGLEKYTSWLIRPANYAPGAPGKGWTIVELPGGASIAVVNLLGRVFMNFPLDCPFRAMEALRAGPLSSVSMIICDFHAEATSEKIAFGKKFCKQLSLVFGTHTHVQTADEVILENHCAYISDLGMCGSQEGVIGMHKDVAIERFLSGLPLSYEVAPGEGWLHGVICEIDEQTGAAASIQRIREKVSES